MLEATLCKPELQMEMRWNPLFLHLSDWTLISFLSAVFESQK